MALLSTTEIERSLQMVPDWKLVRHEILRTFVFPDFVTAVRFVNRVAEMAESMAHHPDIDIRYNKVRLAVSTHDAGGLTESDFKLAASCDQAFQDVQV